MKTNKSVSLAKRSSSKSRPRRSASAVIELAVCMPVLVLLGLGAIEGANKIFVRQAAVMATYEAAKAISNHGGTTAKAQTLCSQVLQSRGIQQHTLAFNPANPDQLEPGELFSVTVTVPGSARTVTGIGPFQNAQIQYSATMSKE